MTPAQLTLPMLLAILIAGQRGQLYPPQAPVMTREQIKAARDKFDREMKLDTKRPWDGMDLTGPHALQKPSKLDK
jgi:hypothetical protein